MKIILPIITVIFLSWNSFAVASLTIEIDQSSNNAQPIAVIPFVTKITAKEGAALPKTNIAKVISDNLYRSGKFKALPLHRLL